MILNKETDILKEIKKKQYNIYYIYGNENYLKKNYYKTILDINQIDNNDTFNFHEFSYQKSDIDEVIDACLAVPVFAPKKCVVIKDIEINSIPKYDNDKILELIESVPEECVLIILQLSVEVDDRKSAKDKKFIKQIDNNGLAIKLSTRNESNIIKFIVGYAKKNGMEISTVNAKYLVSKCGNSFDVLSSELDKVCAYDREFGEVSKETIDKLVTVNLDTSIYELSRSINQQDYGRAMNILSKLEQMQEEPIVIFNVLSSIYVDLFRAKSAIQDGYSQDVISQSFNYKGREFLVKNALSDASRTSWYFIAGALSILREADLNLKKVSSNGYIIIEKAIAELFILKADGR